MMSTHGFTNEKFDHKAKLGEDGLASTNHIGQVYLQNDWGADLFSVTIRHRRGNDADKQEQLSFNNVAAGAKVGPMKITYETGFTSPFDYWWIKFQLSNGATYSCKNSFYCYISSSDDGVVLLRIDGADKALYVSFSSSSGCRVDLSTVPGVSADD